MSASQWRAGRPGLKRRAAMRPGAAIAVAAVAFLVVGPGASAAGDTGDTGDATDADASSLVAMIGTEIHDATITTKAKAAMFGREDLSSGDIHVTTRHGDVLLTGSVPDEQQHIAAVRIVKQIDGVQHVRDELSIRAK
ncbi:BON domain-containing protein [Burkholderia stagnalis]|uniref:BON domain-containing protein n=1 Tax=Burkholderia stagnalis TaxID=1503054 RepID=UPI0007529CFA|nr:BON domain-containing protein [Burkholderia stagnalis]KVM80352.1 transporter [Burkholderia stagnalis]